jgi:hypothetical protein
MELYLKSLALGLLLFPAGAFPQAAIPPATVLPLQLSSSLNSAKSKPGQIIKARIMQDVPLPQQRRIHVGAKVAGRVVMVRTANNGLPAEIALRFESLNFAHKSIAIITSLRALASTMEVEDAQIPPSGPDRGTPWAWTTRNLIGGEVAYGEGGPVSRGMQTVGQALASGVLVPVRANPGSGCRGEIAGNREPQALWVFSSDACGVYGFVNVQIGHAGRTPPLGQIALISKHGDLKVSSGSGLLLRIEEPTQ